MTGIVQYLGDPNEWGHYQPSLTKALRDAGLTMAVANDAPPEQVDYIVYAPVPGRKDDFADYTKAKAVLSLWAGVERIVSNPTLTQPLARMADTGLQEGMVEWVTAHVLRYHLGMDAHIHGQDGIWRAEVVAPLARSRTVGVLGLGALGAACAQALAALNFNVIGWSRNPKSVPGVTCFAGQDQLPDVLARSEILVLLLPNTPATENTLNRQTLALMPKGAFVINPGRGPLIDDDALLHALNTGQIAHATLDVFRVEPLPADHAYWSHPSVTVTPHIASATRVETASQFVATNIARAEAGQPLVAQVDREVGY